MNQKSLYPLFICTVLLVLTLTMVGCGSTPAATAVPIAAATETPTEIPPSATPNPTDTPEPSNTPTATNTATPVPTDTPEPSPTATDTPSPSPEPSDTPTATSTPLPPATATSAPTTVPPTAVPPTSPPPTNMTAHTFPETPIQAWNADTFVQYLGLVRDSFRSFNSEYQHAINDDKPFDCGTFVGWTGLWILEAPGFTDVPADWQPLYVEYRDNLRQIVSLTAEIRPLCNAQGGEISEESSMAILAFLLGAYPRMEQMVVEANQLPR